MSSINPYLAIPVLKDGISVEIVNSFKDCGNDHFQKNKYSKAIDEYTQGIECFRHDHDTNEGFDDSLCSLLAYLYSNRAASYVKTLTMEYLTNGIRDANMCIKLRPTWLKGYYRRAESLFLMKEYRLAALDYQKALELDPQKSDTLLRKLRYCQAKDKEFDQKIIVHQISAQTEICKRGFNPIQNLIFTYASKILYLKTRTNAEFHLYCGRCSIEGMYCN
jgi:tetratricopeptide (TPR) repeat protein